MRIRIAELAFAILTVFALSAVISAATPKATHHAQVKRTALPCGDLIGFQVLLDRAGFSPGQIDGKSGVDFSRALKAAQTARGLTASAKPDCDTWNALNDGAEPTMTTYTVTADDVKGPFHAIPRDVAQQASLDALDYTSALEGLAERFHTSPELLRQLNPHLDVAEGRSIRVPAVTPFDPDKKPTIDPASPDVTIVVSKDDSALRATRVDGTVVFYAPVTTGSVHDPLPIGDYKVLGERWRPSFHYNPNLFWDAKEGDSKETIKPGPNNPVGIVWISLNLEHYGIHGTPEPGRIGHTESHGCVRLTNWDAARVAALVKPGTPVQFR
jgi:lipoprotein-anchoring transpeptidase ErfK/SrfK